MYNDHAIAQKRIDLLVKVRQHDVFTNSNISQKQTSYQ